MRGILGRKIGMTTVFSNEGKAIPVTVIESKPNVILQVKDSKKDGYNSIKLGVEDKKENKSIKPEIGFTKKAKTSPKYFVKEIRDMDLVDSNIGDVIKVDLFNVGEYVDVTGVSKGKGFQGNIKRHNQSRGPMTHGSKSHRITGSIGDIAGHVIKGKKMPGHMGHNKITMQNLEVISIDVENNLILIKGSIPGPNKSFVVVREAVKKTSVKNPVVLLNVKEEHIKNELLEEAKKFGAEVNTSMSISEMKSLIEEASVKHKEELKEFDDLLKEAKDLGMSKYEKMKLPELREAVSKARQLDNSRNDKVEEPTNNDSVKEEIKEEVKEETTVQEEAPAQEEPVVAEETSQPEEEVKEGEE